MIAAVEVGGFAVGAVTAAAAVALTRSWWQEARVSRVRREARVLPARSHVRRIERPAGLRLAHHQPVGRSPIDGSGKDDGSPDPSTHIAGGDAFDLALHRADAARRAARDWHPSTMDSAR